MVPENLKYYVNNENGNTKNMNKTFKCTHVYALKTLQNNNNTLIRDNLSKCKYSRIRRTKNKSNKHNKKIFRDVFFYIFRSL